MHLQNTKELDILHAGLLLKTDIHIGTSRTYWNPLLQPYLFGERHGILFFDIVKILPPLQKVSSVITKISEKHSQLLFVGSSDYAKLLTNYLCLKSRHFAVNKKWVGGTLTNWKSLRLYMRFLYYAGPRAIHDRLIFKTQDEIERKMKRYTEMKYYFQDLLKMKAIPNLVFVFEDNRFYANAEIKILHLPSVAVVNTDQLHYGIMYPIFGNTRSMDSLLFMTNIFLQAIKQGFLNRRVFYVKQGLNLVQFMSFIKKAPGGIRKTKAASQVFNSFISFYNQRNFYQSTHYKLYLRERLGKYIPLKFNPSIKRKKRRNNFK